MDVFDGNSCAFQDSVLVTVNALPTVDAGLDTTICAGESITIGGNPTGPAGSSYQWSNGSSLDDANAANPLANPTASLTFAVTVTDANQCVNADSVVVNINPLPSVNAGADVSICPGDSVQLGATGAVNYSWSPISDLSDPNIADPFASPSGTTIYTVSTTDANLCTGTDDVAVNVLPPPPANAGADVALCIGDTVQLLASGGSSYSWSPGTDLTAINIPDPQAFPTSTITYTVTVTDTNNCTATDDVMVTVNALPSVDAGGDQTICDDDVVQIGGAPTGPVGSSYTWSPGPGLDNTNSANPNASPDSTITYTVVVTDGNNCVASDQVMITVNPLPVLFAGNDTAICLNTSAQLNALGTGAFSWSPTADLNDPLIANPIATPVIPTTYTVTLTDGNNCSSTDNVFVDVLALPTADAGADVWLCPGSSVPLSGTGGTTYSWSPGSSLNDSTIASPDASPLMSTVFILTVFDMNGCQDSDSVLVTVNDDVPVDAGADTSICVGDSVIIGGFPASIGGTSYMWSPSATLDNSALANPLAFPSSSTTYTLTVTNDTCTNSDQMIVNVQGDANAAFSVRLEPRCDGLRAWFFNETIGVTDFLWDFGNGNTSTEENPQFIFDNGQAIVVTLTVNDGSGCSSSVTQTYSTYNFADFVSLSLPNVFTPNGDGDNDVFGPQSNVVLGPCASLTVFNRWGSEVFKTTGGDIAWSGFTFAGEPAIEGTYFYIFEVEGIELKGHLELRR